MKKKITIVDKDLNQLVVVADCSSALYQDRARNSVNRIFFPILPSPLRSMMERFKLL